MPPKCHNRSLNSTPKLLTIAVSLGLLCGGNAIAHPDPNSGIAEISVNGFYICRSDGFVAASPATHC